MILFWLNNVAADENHHKMFLFQKYHTQGKSYVRDCAFISILNEENGGAISNTDDALLSVSGCSFYKLSAYYFGGSIYKCNGNFELISSCFTDSYVMRKRGDGHALFSKHNDFKIERTSFSKCSEESKHGDSVHLTGNSLSVLCGNFSNINIPLNAVLFISETKKITKLSQCTFLNNTAKYSIASQECENVFVEISRFSNNTYKMMFYGTKYNAKMCSFFKNNLEEDIFNNVEIVESFYDQRVPGLWYMREEITPKATPNGQGECIFKVKLDEQFNESRSVRLIIFSPRNTSRL